MRDRMRRVARGAVGLWLLVAGCGDDGTGGADAAPRPDAAPRADAAPPDAGLPTTFGGDRPAELLVPANYDPAVPAPLVVLLHGYSEDPTFITGYTRFDTLVDSEGVLVIAPPGLKDGAGKGYWNATDACCDFEGSGVDDVAYLAGIVADIRAAYNVDPKRIFAIGHSNGGFMAYRLACDMADTFAAVVSIAGATFADSTACSPAEPVSVLQVHGDADQTILYDGGAIEFPDGAMRAYPSAADTVAMWAGYDGCATTTAAGTAFDLDLLAADAETTPSAYDGCPSGVGVELWTAAGSGHVMSFSDAVPGVFWAWMKAHPKP
ncbi:MAG: hypothetical protein D6689_12470 [Deltaproteobacteria bacterium]|nr:MAG: hypothetical protein D6689_12470 [Deltaproteobacteria bacterium]